MGITQIGSVRRIIQTRMPTRWGEFQVHGIQREICNGTRRFESAVALVMGDLASLADPEGPAPLVRIHSQCLTGEAFGSLRCDCGEQFGLAMRAIAREGRGLVIYEHQEGRGIGLMAKLGAYALQDAGLDTVEANHALGFRADERDYNLPAAILQDLGIGRVRLLTNNPDKVRALTRAGIQVVARLPCEAAPNTHSRAYLTTKQEKMGHQLNLGPERAFSGGDRGVAEETEAEPHNHFSEALPRLAEPSAIPPSPSDYRLSHSPFASIEQAVHDLRAGRMVVVVDDEDRENEGDLTMLADKVTPEAINFMAAHGRGLICLAMTGERLNELQLAPMAPENSALHSTAFTVSIDARGCGCTTGISARDRALTIWTAIDPGSRPDDLARPGHIFPLRARPGGVLERRGQTEAAVDLARLAGCEAPAGVICEIINEDGTMARVPDLVRFCGAHGLLMVTVADLARYRLERVGDQNPSTRVERPTLRRTEEAA